MIPTSSAARPALRPGPAPRTHHEEGRDAGEHLERGLDADVEDVGQDERQRDGEHGRPRRHEAIHQAHPALEVVAQDHQRGRVGQRRPAAEHQPVRDHQDFHLQAGRGGKGGGQWGKEGYVTSLHQTNKQKRTSPESGGGRGLSDGDVSLFPSTFLLLPIYDFWMYIKRAFFLPKFILD